VLVISHAKQLNESVNKLVGTCEHDMQKSFTIFLLLLVIVYLQYDY